MLADTSRGVNSMAETPDDASTNQSRFLSECLVVDFKAVILG